METISDNRLQFSDRPFLLSKLTRFNTLISNASHGFLWDVIFIDAMTSTAIFQDTIRIQMLVGRRRVKNDQSTSRGINVTTINFLLARLSSEITFYSCLVLCPKHVINMVRSSLLKSIMGKPSMPQNTNRSFRCLVILTWSYRHMPSYNS